MCYMPAWSHVLQVGVVALLLEARANANGARRPARIHRLLRLLQLLRLLRLQQLLIEARANANSAIPPLSHPPRNELPRCRPQLAHTERHGFSYSAPLHLCLWGIDAAGGGMSDSSATSNTSVTAGGGTIELSGNVVRRDEWSNRHDDAEATTEAAAAVEVAVEAGQAEESPGVPELGAVEVERWLTILRLLLEAGADANRLDQVGTSFSPYYPSQSVPPTWPVGASRNRYGRNRHGTVTEPSRNRHGTVT